MCTTCGCSVESADSKHDHHERARLIEVEQDLLSRNNRFAEQNRVMFKHHDVLALNMVSSPGSGKTTLLVETITEASKAVHKMNIGVIEGDQQTNRDAERIAATGAPSHQLNTGKGCHLDAHQVGHALEHFDLEQTDVLFIENVGNLVCPAAFDLGEFAKIVVLSVTEGEDKPLKYPDMFHAASLMIINKIDLLPYVDFDVQQAIEFAQRVNPDIEVVQLSAKTHEGFDQWLAWLTQSHAALASQADCVKPEIDTV